ncbi:MAG: hypothetical protein HY928_00315 [Elusimicrobia bacterium]|nr:hypothetical protein [Elusimicrobiota bacterium]
MPADLTPLSDDEVLALKARYRSWMYRVAAAVAMAGFMALLLLSGVQAVLLRGPRPVFLWGPAGIALAALLACAAKRRWGLALLCGASIAVMVRVLSDAARLAAR